ncbi:MAG: twin-arginine translocation signal domain-containing protein, partial [Epsilonproteobacteria bacterium]|nr:twin-arginine translocation signal domain-containing protein [Campylobacterota bacterium]
MKRREFLKSSLVASAAVLGSNALASTKVEMTPP